MARTNGKIVRTKSKKKLTQAQKIDAIYAALCGASITIEHPRAKPKYLRIGNFEVYDRDIGVMTWVDFDRAVKVLYSDKQPWVIPTREQLLEIYKNQDSTFHTKPSGSGYPDRYWSSTEDRDDSSYVHSVRFSDGGESWNRKDGSRLSCRPVRLVD